MGTEELSKRTAVNIQEKANLIWAIADKLFGTYKPHEYGNVILPMCVIKRFSDTLAATKDKVLEMNETLDKRGLAVKEGFLKTASGFILRKSHERKYAENVYIIILKISRTFLFFKIFSSFQIKSA